MEREELAERSGVGGTTLRRYGARWHPAGNVKVLLRLKACLEAVVSLLRVILSLIPG